MEDYFQDQTNFEVLPTEVKMIVFSYLGLNDKKAARLVCKEWCEISSYLMKLQVTLSDDTLKFVKKCFSRQVQTIKVVDLKTANFVMSSSRQASIPESIFLHLKSGNSRENVLKLLHYYCPNVEKLVLDNLALESLSLINITAVIPYVDWTTLKHIRLQIHGYANSNGRWISGNHHNHIDMLGKFLEVLTAPSIEIATLNFKNSHALFRFGEATFLPELDNLYTTFYDFISRHHKTLTGVEATLKGRQFFSRGCHEIIKQKMQKLKLETLILNFDFDNLDVASHLCCAGNRLKKFVYDKSYSIMNSTTDAPASLIQTLNRNKKTMEQLTLHRVTYNSVLLEGFENLKQLNIVGWSPANMKQAPILPRLQSFALDTYFISATAHPAIVVNDIIEWICHRMPNLEVLDLNLNNTCLLTGDNLNMLLQKEKIRKLSLCRVDRESVLTYCTEQKIDLKDDCFNATPDLMKKKFFKFTLLKPQCP